jgi:hypothetical protein
MSPQYAVGSVAIRYRTRLSTFNVFAAANKPFGHLLVLRPRIPMPPTDILRYSPDVVEKLSEKSQARARRLAIMRVIDA